MNRYNLRKIQHTDNKQYVPYLKDRGLKFIAHHETCQLNYPTSDQLGRLQIISKVWTYGDSFWNLSQEHYGDHRYWWVIAWYNQRPTECDIALGEIIQIPLPLNKIIEFLRV